MHASSNQGQKFASYTKRFQQAAIKFLLTALIKQFFFFLTRKAGFNFENYSPGEGRLLSSSTGAVLSMTSTSLSSSRHSEDSGVIASQED